MTNNLKLWEMVREVPETAKKPISGGRLNGKSDINPVWRIKTLTEQCGICGVGWKYVIKDKRLEKGANDEIAAFVDINLFLKIGEAWSDAIPGTGGSMFVAKEKNGLFTSDECFKMALTDAISVSCKALGIGADVYWEKDKTKYDQQQQTPPAPAQTAQKSESDTISDAQVKELQNYALSRHGKDNFTKCIKDLNGALKIEKMKQIKIGELTFCREFIENWTDTQLPFTLE